MTKKLYKNIGIFADEFYTGMKFVPVPEKKHKKRGLFSPRKIYHAFNPMATFSPPFKKSDI